MQQDPRAIKDLKQYFVRYVTDLKPRVETVDKEDLRFVNIANACRDPLIEQEIIEIRGDLLVVLDAPHKLMGRNGRADEIWAKIMMQWMGGEVAILNEVDLGRTKADKHVSVGREYDPGCAGTSSPPLA